MIVFVDSKCGKTLKGRKICPLFFPFLNYMFHCSLVVELTGGEHLAPLLEVCAPEGGMCCYHPASISICWSYKEKVCPPGRLKNGNLKRNCGSGVGHSPAD